MKENLEAYMRVGIVHFMAFPDLAGGTGPWEETVRHIALDPFFNAIEITHIEDFHVRERVKNLIHLARLSVGYGAHPSILSQGLNCNSIVEEERLHACEALKAHIDEAIFMGAESFVILTGKDPGDEKRSEATGALIKSLNDLCAYSAEKGGPKIVVEVFDREIDKCCLLGPAQLCREVSREITKKNDNFGLLVDLSHIPLLGESPEEALIPLKGYLSSVHLGNAVMEAGYPGYGDNHPSFGAPGSANDVPEVAAFLRCLFDIGFLGGASRPMVSFEVKPMEGQDPLVVIANAKRVLRQAWTIV